MWDAPSHITLWDAKHYAYHPKTQKPLYGKIGLSVYPRHQPMVSSVKPATKQLGFKKVSLNQDSIDIGVRLWESRKHINSELSYQLYLCMNCMNLTILTSWLQLEPLLVMPKPGRAGSKLIQRLTLGTTKFRMIIFRNHGFQCHMFRTPGDLPPKGVVVISNIYYIYIYK